MAPTLCSLVPFTAGGYITGRFYWLLPNVVSRYCASLLEKEAPTHQINYDTPLKLAVDVIKRFRPSQLSDPLRSSAGNTFKLPLEDQYQKEFYRCLFTTLEGAVIVSPELVVKEGTGGGTIDFFIAPKKWGFELLRGRDRVVKHMERFGDGGQYFSMIQSRSMEQYIVLDFTVMQPRKRRPGMITALLLIKPELTPLYHGHLYHVLFSENYRNVEVIDASDLSTFDHFVLLEEVLNVTARSS